MGTAPIYHSWTRLLKNASIIILLASLSIVGCGFFGSEDDETDPDDNHNTGWVEISYHPVLLDEDGNPYALLSGTAFRNTSYSRHNCVGLCCLFCSYDDSYPGVNVIWTNQTSGLTGTATYRYGTATDWVHYWYANVPLTLGINTLQVTASDPDGNHATAETSIEYSPLAPTNLWLDTGEQQIRLNWNQVQGATSYRIYWSTGSGGAYPYGAVIDVENPPYVHDDLLNGTTYYYVVTSLHVTSESEPSQEISATAGVPSRPTNITVNLIGPDIEIVWNPVARADIYTLYWSNEPGVTKQNGNPIIGAISPVLHTGLSGIPYYYVVTASNGYGESFESEEAGAFPELAPPAPTGLRAVQRPDMPEQQVIDLSWGPVPGAINYEVFRCYVVHVLGGLCDSIPWDCRDPWESIGTTPDLSFADWTVSYGWPSSNELYVYKYYIAAENTFGISEPSDWVRMCVTGP